jgi:hypothetical protein
MNMNQIITAAVVILLAITVWSVTTGNNLYIG